MLAGQSDSDPGDALLVVTLGLSFKNLPIHALLNREVMYPGHRCFLDLDPPRFYGLIFLPY